MHGVITVFTAKNRKGRKRKQRIKLQGLGGIVVHTAEKQPDYRALTAMQPHRVCLLERWREDHRAGTELGWLLLTGALGSPNGDGTLSERAQALHEAGRLFSGVVSRYRAMIGSPRAPGGAGKGYGCVADEFCDPHSCECRYRTSAYNSAFEALSELGHRVQVIVSRVAVHDEPCYEDQVGALKIGLGALIRHFGLKA
jgi:hypothetical protein